MTNVRWAEPACVSSLPLCVSLPALLPPLWLQHVPAAGVGTPRPRVVTPPCRLLSPPSREKTPSPKNIPPRHRSPARLPQISERRRGRETSRAGKAGDMEIDLKMGVFFLAPPTLLRQRRSPPALEAAEPLARTLPGCRGAPPGFLLPPPPHPPCFVRPRAALAAGSHPPGPGLPPHHGSHGRRSSALPPRSASPRSGRRLRT